MLPNRYSAAEPVLVLRCCTIGERSENQLRMVADDCGDRIAEHSIELTNGIDRVHADVETAGNGVLDAPSRAFAQRTHERFAADLARDVRWSASVSGHIDRSSMAMAEHFSQQTERVVMERCKEYLLDHAAALDDLGDTFQANGEIFLRSRGLDLDAGVSVVSRQQAKSVFQQWYSLAAICRAEPFPGVELR